MLNKGVFSEILSNGEDNLSDSIALIFSSACSICIPKLVSYIRYIKPLLSTTFSGVKPLNTEAGIFIQSKISGFSLKVKSLWIENKVAEGLIQKNIDNFYHRAWVINKNIELNNICEECKKEDESVKQNLIMHSYKICRSCNLAKTIFPL